MITLTPEQLEQIQTALNFADTYILYVKENYSIVHEQADGTKFSSCEQEVSKAVATVATIATSNQLQG